MMEKPSTGTPGSAEASTVHEVVELIRLLCVADNNLSVFTLEHPLTRGAITAAYEWLKAIIARRKAAVTLSLAPDRFLFEQIPLELRNPQVARLFRKMNALHVNSIRFHPGLTREHLEGFHEILAMSAEDVASYGGVAAILTKARINTITLSGASYVMVDEDQKVVSRNARVLDEQLSAAEADEAMLRDLLKQVMSRAGGRDWMLTKFKNDPRRMSELILGGMEKALAETETPDQQETIHSLVDNVKLIAQSLTDPASGEIKEGETELKDALLELESEIRNRSQKLMTTGSSVKFVNELLNVVTSYADQVKSQRISDEFLKDEASLKKTERLLRSLTAKHESAPDMVQRLKSMMQKRGMKEPDIARLADTAAKVSQPRIRKPFDKALEDGIAQRLHGLGDTSQQRETMGKLVAFVDGKLREKEREFRTKERVLNESIDRRDDFIDGITSCGVVIWDEEGRVEHINSRAASATGLEKGTQLSAETRNLIVSRDGRPDAASTPAGSTPQDKLPGLVIAVVRNSRGLAVGALLKER
jgi:hypothetical protein